MPAEIPPTVTGWPSAADNCCARAARTASSVKTDRTQRNKPVAATSTKAPTPSNTFLDIRALQGAPGEWIDCTAGFPGPEALRESAPHLREAECFRRMRPAQ